MSGPRRVSSVGPLRLCLALKPCPPSSLPADLAIRPLPRGLSVLGLCDGHLSFGPGEHHPLANRTRVSFGGSASPTRHPRAVVGRRRTPSRWARGTPDPAGELSAPGPERRPVLVTRAGVRRPRPPPVCARRRPWPRKEGGSGGARRSLASAASLRPPPPSAHCLPLRVCFCLYCPLRGYPSMDLGPIRTMQEDLVRRSSTP